VFCLTTETSCGYHLVVIQKKICDLAEFGFQFNIKTENIVTFSVMMAVYMDCGFHYMRLEKKEHKVEGIYFDYIIVFTDE
jgi:hypothetical protein